MTLSGRTPLQNPGELEALIALFRAEGVRSFLEIGSRFGDTLWDIGRSLPAGRIVSVDLPLFKPGIPDPRPYLAHCLAGLGQMGHEVHAVAGDSTAPETIGKVRALGPFDAALIDGDHSFAGCMADFENYGPMARLAAFHDITPIARPAGKHQIDVPAVWEKVKQGRQNVEFKYQAAGYGIGVVWI